jgi:hypothetical protein
MAYEDPNAPSPVSANYVQESSSPVDQSKSFLGGKHHPWRRLFARTVVSVQPSHLPKLYHMLHA